MKKSLQNYNISDAFVEKWKEFILSEYYGKYQIFPTIGPLKVTGKFNKDNPMTLEDIEFWFVKRRSDLGYENEKYFISITLAVDGKFGFSFLVSCYPKNQEKEKV